MLEKPVLYGEIITLRPIVKEDAPGMFAALDDAESMRLTGTQATFTFEQQPRDNRNVVALFDGFLAQRTFGWRMNQGLLAGHPHYHNVEERPHGQTKDTEENKQQGCSHGSRNLQTPALKWSHWYGHRWLRG